MTPTVRFICAKNSSKNAFDRIGCIDIGKDHIGGLVGEIQRKEKRSGEFEVGLTKQPSKRSVKQYETPVARPIDRLTSHSTASLLFRCRLVEFVRAKQKEGAAD